MTSGILLYNNCSYLDIRLSSKFLSTNVTFKWLPLAVSEHVFLHVTRPPHLFVTNVTLMIATNIVALRHVVLVVRLVVKLGFASLARECFRLASADFLVSFQVAVRDKFLFTTLALESLSLRQRDVLLKVSHDLERKNIK